MAGVREFVIVGRIAARQPVLRRDRLLRRIRGGGRRVRGERAPVAGALGERGVLTVVVGVVAGVGEGTVVAVAPAVAELLGSALGLRRGAVLRLCVLNRRTVVSLGVGCFRRSPLRQPRWWLHAVIHAVLLREAPWSSLSGNTTGEGARSW